MTENTQIVRIKGVTVAPNSNLSPKDIEKAINQMIEDRKSGKSKTYKKFPEDKGFLNGNTIKPDLTHEEHSAAIAESVAAERERCAKVCEKQVSNTIPNFLNPTHKDHQQMAWDA